MIVIGRSENFWAAASRSGVANSAPSTRAIAILRSIRMPSSRGRRMLAWARKKFEKQPHAKNINRPRGAAQRNGPASGPVRLNEKGKRAHWGSVAGFCGLAGRRAPEPGPLLGRVDLHLEQARRRNVLVVVGELVR